MTSFGPVEVEVPRARLQTATGTPEFTSDIVRRSAWRTRRLDAALVASYLTGTNTRKIRLALKPLVEGTAMSRSAVSVELTAEPLPGAVGDGDDADGSTQHGHRDRVLVNVHTDPGGGRLHHDRLL